MSYNRQLSFVIIMSTYRYNKIKHYKIKIDVARIVFNEEDFHCF